MAYFPHEFCLLPDALDPSELVKLEVSMQESGFWAESPIILYEGKILDGWHRYQAALRVGVEPVFVDFTGTRLEALERAFMSLFARRHVPLGRKAAIAMLYERQRQAMGQQPRTHLEIATEANVSTPYISQASSVANRDPQQLVRIAGGDLALGKAYKELEQSVPERLENERDPLAEVWLTKEKWERVCYRLQEIADRDIDALKARPGSEAIVESLLSPSMDADRLRLGATFTQDTISRIKQNLPHKACEECLGEGCEVCRWRGWLPFYQARSRR